MTDDQRMWAELICGMVAEGMTLREIAGLLGCSCGTVLNRATCTPEAVEQYTRARDAAADLFEADILARAAQCSSATAAADRVAIDALKWVAGRRAPKRYGDRVQQDHTSSDGSMSPKTFSEMYGSKADDDGEP